jgi:aconitate hydratase
MIQDPFKAYNTIKTAAGDVGLFRLDALEKQGLTEISRLPFSVRVLLESVLRQINGKEITGEDVRNLAGWQSGADKRPEVPYLPARVIMQDFTGVPAVVDLAAMRSALERMGGDPQKISPRIPVDLVIDHSVQVDCFASPEALRCNAEMEFTRNRERYEFLRWGSEAFDRFRVVPPATGIVHQVNLEYLGKVVQTREVDGETVALPDTLVGTDSHTTMINGLGILGWGVGGIEAEAAVLGQPMVILTPDVIGFRLTGELPEGTTATDLVLTVTEMLRGYGVVGKFVEFFGPGLDTMTLPDRATIANMSPEYGATAGFFPVDDETLRYLRETGRDDDLVDLVERYTKEQGLFRTTDAPEPSYTDVLELDMGTVEPSLAGPRRPQDRIALAEMKASFEQALPKEKNDGGFGVPADRTDAAAPLELGGAASELKHGSVVIAAVTSCTNTSNPDVMVGAGLLAKKAVERGLKVKPYVKTSLAPGSRVVTEYLEKSGLDKPLEALGFHLVGYGCTTCIGNSGPLPEAVVEAINEHNIVASAVLSGNRNFEGRINPHVQANYLASPPLVVAYALAGTTDIDLSKEPLGKDEQGKPVFLKYIWPSSREIHQTISESLTPDMFTKDYSDVFTGNETWNQTPVTGGAIYRWSEKSTYIQEPPFFVGMSRKPAPFKDIEGARVLALLGDTVTTDHISPAGAIPEESPAGQYLIEHGVEPKDFNSYGSRRGNDQVMTRGTFGNIRLRNQLVPGVEGGYTRRFPDGEQTTIYDAAVEYEKEGVPLIVLAGREYGTGSSRDWAAKGTLLLGVKAVIAKSYERIHRSNLVGMGVLPLQFMPGEGAEELGLVGSEVYTVCGLEGGFEPGDTVQVTARRAEGLDGREGGRKEGRETGTALEFTAKIRIDTPIEVDYYQNGGILHMVLRRMLG